MRTEITEALTRAFFREWARVGYSGLSLERVARLGRRWESCALQALARKGRYGQ